MLLSDLGAHEARYIVNRLRAGDQEEAYALRAGNSYELLKEILEDYGPHKWCASLERPIAMGGVTEMWPGVWCGWALATNEFPRIAAPLTRWVRRKAMPAIKRAGAHRLEVRSIESHTQSHRWLEILGFEREAVLRGYGRSQENFVVYRWE